MYKSEEKVIWSLEEYKKALDACDSIQLRVFLELAAQASQRIGEITGLLWEDVHIEKDMSASLVFRHQLQRVSIVNADAAKQYESCAVVPSGVNTKDKQPPKTQLCLVSMKSKGHGAPKPRTVFVGPELAADLLKLHERKENIKRYIGDKYTDLGFVLAQDNGRPYEEHPLRKLLAQLCKENDLPVITPHAMRHWSISLKLLLTGDVKAVQADSGQKNTQMVLDRYSHAFVEGRKKMAFTVENAIKAIADQADCS